MSNKSKTFKQGSKPIEVQFNKTGVSLVIDNGNYHYTSIFLPQSEAENLAVFIYSEILSRELNGKHSKFATIQPENLNDNSEVV